MQLKFQSMQKIKYLTFQSREQGGKTKEDELVRCCDLFSYPKNPFISSSWI